MPIDYAYHRFDKTTVSCRCPVCGYLNRKQVNVDSLPDSGDTVMVSCDSCESIFRGHYVGGEVVAIEDEEDEDNEDP